MALTGSRVIKSISAVTGLDIWNSNKENFRSLLSITCAEGTDGSLVQQCFSIYSSSNSFIVDKVKTEHYRELIKLVARIFISNSGSLEPGRFESRRGPGLDLSCQISHLKLREIESGELLPSEPVR